ncbi:hypothetical protein DWX17_07470 [[Clostridium] innocuum]|uniref:hypothetical protein n=1 Tax=Clostridium innocuum TaxID=1522 RepID=UPI000E48203A|nr:hypothetical protein [[Clostridium] innocuum]RGT69251.1 hypothetical protein DWX17_07470 [[Clostridium] innocuum]
MLPAIKVWKMDYSFIVKNYLNPALWQKTWTLFEYKDFVITIKLTKIETENMRIVFRLNLRDNSRPNTWGDQEDVSYSLKCSSIKFLIKSINGAIFRMISYHERNHVLEDLPVYIDAKQQGDIEIEKLTVLASEFLDDEGVTNEEIREAYIDKYVDDNKQNDEYIQRLRSAYEYHLLTDFYLVFAESIGDDAKYQTVMDRLEENEIENVLKEISQYKTYIETDDYQEEMKGLLEEI